MDYEQRITQHIRVGLRHILPSLHFGKTSYMLETLYERLCQEQNFGIKLKGGDTDGRKRKF